MVTGGDAVSEPSTASVQLPGFMRGKVARAMRGVACLLLPSAQRQVRRYGLRPDSRYAESATRLSVASCGRHVLGGYLMERRYVMFGWRPALL